jgi:Co/Zn/Cd efflux system component
MEHHNSVIKFTVVYIIDVIFAVFTFWDILDHTLRTIAALGVLISTIYLIQKHRSEHQVNKERKKLLEMENQIKQQELFRAIAENKKLTG